MAHIPINNDVVLDSIIDELKTKHHCHTIILYGSRARGDYTLISDYDVAGISSSGKKQRIARFDDKHQVYLDVFVYPESELSLLNDEHLNMADGVVIIEQDAFGTNLLTQLKQMINKPELISDNEINVRKVWYKKMADRAAIGDIEGRYRHIWAIFTILEDYFVFNSVRYQGPKKAFQYLEQHDRKTLALFNEVLNNTTNVDALNRLIERVIA